jgi:uncharacterized membrane protein (DUF4010 family)
MQPDAFGFAASPDPLIQTLLQLGLALAIGLLVGVERHWRERNAEPGTRTASLRTFGLSGLLGGVTAMVAHSPAFSGAVGAAIVMAATLVAYAVALIVFKLREAAEDETNSVTTVVAAILVFVLGSMAVLGDRTVAAAAGVAMTALLASREVLHGMLRRLTWVELRSAVIILVMSFVVLPLVPRRPLGPFGGIDFAEVWTMAILMATVSYTGYIAMRLYGAQRGLLVAGALGGLASSTAVTLDFARRAAANEAPAGTLAAGAMAASAVAVVRIGVLALALQPPLLVWLGPVLASMVLIFVGSALVQRRHGGSAAELTPARFSNPFDLRTILRFTLLLVVAALFVKAGSAWLGEASVVPLAAIAGLADADAVVLSMARLSGGALAPVTLALAVCAAIASDIVVKALYALTFGGKRFGLTYAFTALAALGAGTAMFWIVSGLDRLVFLD